jgi:hypothetical protein
MAKMILTPNKKGKMILTPKARPVMKVTPKATTTRAKAKYTA